jgi:Flp pilus assembly protein TadD
MRKLAFALTAAILFAGPVAVRAADAAGLGPTSGPSSLDPARQRSLYLAIIESLRREGSARAALAHLDSYDRMHPHDPRAEILRADCLADIGDRAAAEAPYRKAAGGPYAARASSGRGHL